MSGRNILITGCSHGGIGYALASEFQGRGLNVFATARNTTRMAGLETLPNITLLALDVSSESSVTEAVEKVKTLTGGKLDYLLNNAGQDIILPGLDTGIDDGKALFEVNFWGVLRTIQAFAPLLIEAEGTIVNIGSIVADLYAPYGAIYNASKAAVHTLSETLRLELAPLNVKVLTVVAGAVKTNINRNVVQQKLPPTSRYGATEKFLEKRWMDEVDYKSMAVDIFAQKVAGDVLAGGTGKIWRGSFATVTRYARHLMLVWVLDKLLLHGTDLAKVGKAMS